MLEALREREAYRPRWEGGDAVGLVSRSALQSASRPRSAITLSLAAPGLAPTGRVSLGRGDRRRQRRSEVRPNHHYGRRACRGFEACDRLLSEDGAALAFLVDSRQRSPWRESLHVPHLTAGPGAVRMTQKRLGTATLAPSTSLSTPFIHESASRLCMECG